MAGPESRLHFAITDRGSQNHRLWFRRRKSLAGRRPHALVNESLEAPSIEVFTHVEVPAAVNREGMRNVQRSAEDPLLSDVVDHLEGLTQKNPDVVVRAVDHV